jgi:hypothetical protein
MTRPAATLQVSISSPLLGVVSGIITDYDFGFDIQDRAGSEYRSINAATSQDERL